MYNLDQARELLGKFKESGSEFFPPEHECTEKCSPILCLRPLILGNINCPATWSGEDILWGPQARGSLFADYDNRSKRLIRLWGVFPMPPDEPSYTEDYTEELLSV